jgi:hypothetical protein
VAGPASCIRVQPGAGQQRRHIQAERDESRKGPICVRKGPIHMREKGSSTSRSANEASVLRRARFTISGLGVNFALNEMRVGCVGSYAPGPGSARWRRSVALSHGARASAVAPLLKFMAGVGTARMQVGAGGATAA